MFSISSSDVNRPPVGSGSYASWVVFIIVIILSVALAEWLLLAIGLRKVR